MICPLTCTQNVTCLSDIPASGSEVKQFVAVQRTWYERVIRRGKVAV